MRSAVFLMNGKLYWWFAKPCISKEILENCVKISLISCYKNLMKTKNVYFSTSKNNFTYYIITCLTKYNKIDHLFKRNKEMGKGVGKLDTKVIIGKWFLIIRILKSKTKQIKNIFSKLKLNGNPLCEVNPLSLVKIHTFVW